LMDKIEVYRKPGTLERVGNYIKAMLSKMRFSGGGTGAWNVTSGTGWSYYNTTGQRINYAARLGDLTLHSLPMAAVRWLGNTLPEAPLVVKRSTTGDKGDSEVDGDHPLLTLLRRPNPYYSGLRLWQSFAMGWILSGNVYFLKLRNEAGQVVELWNVPYWKMQPRWPDGNTTGTFISHYEYLVGSERYEVRPEDVIHFRHGEDPRNDRLGYSPLLAVLRELYNDAELTAYGASLAGGVGVPPYFIGLDAELEVGQEELEEIAARAQRSTSGLNRGKPLVLSGGKAYKLSFTPREMMMDEAHDFPEARFCAAVGIPAVVLELMVGMRHSIYNNVKQAQERAYDSYLKPLQNYIADELTHQLLLPDFEMNRRTLYVSHDYSKVQALQEDESEKVKRLILSLAGGGITVNEYRSQIGMPAAPDGEVYYVPSNMKVVKVGELDKEPEPEPMPLQDGRPNGEARLIG
jgi:HK97 family phage portal protein